ncbi:hypothetical protein [Aliarcobacter butzleri]|uniref:hypothetical protein n=1 Tax=Aliarcobacter butzleri TaxID=28197 RepID=UPI00214A8C64|nr:hypothetical protein [Aliarcobacter butzleri]MCP3649180.1 hypothetical protein [Arcobacter sp. DNRA7]MCR1815354.1 hypothetical protein [Aliarcobacter butzleri]
MNSQDEALLKDNLSSADIIIYEAIDGKTKIETRVSNENIWLSQAQICELYGKSKSTISEHIKAIFEDEELDKIQLFGISEQLQQMVKSMM